MTTLAGQQRGLLALLKRRPRATLSESWEDEWLQRVDGSRELEMLQEIALWWRCFQISAKCRYSSRLLQRLGCFHETVAEYFEGGPTSPFIEQLGPDFLESLESHPDHLIAAMARTERHMGQLQSNEIALVEIAWDRNPDLVFSALDKNEPLPRKDLGFLYRMRIGNELPQGIDCIRLPAKADP